jgi:ankyrin repeat protein
MRLLLDAGADINKTSSWSATTPLYISAAKGHEACVKLLIDYGTDIYKTDIWGNTALSVAAFSGYTTLVKFLLDNGADIDNVNKERCWTPLMFAAAKGHEACVKLLIDYGTDIYKTDINGNTALIIAYTKGYMWRPCRDIEEGNKACVNLLIHTIYKDIAYKVVLAVSQQDIIFDTAFIIFNKIVKETIQNEFSYYGNFNINDPDTYKKLYNIFQEKFSKFKKN